MTGNDQRFIYSSLASDPDFVDLLEEFVLELSVRQKSMREMLESGDHSGLLRMIHQLRGSCGGYGFTSLTNAAGVIDDEYRTGVPFDRLEAQVLDFIATLSQVTASPQPF